MTLLINFLERIQIILEKAMMIVAGSIVMLLMGLITVDVICRKLSISFPGVYETVQILTVAIVFLGISYVQKEKGHIFIKVATTKLPQKMQKGLDFLGYLIGLFICGIITSQSFLVAWESVTIFEYTSGIVHIPVWPAKVIVAIGFMLMTTRIVFDILFFLVPKTKHEEAFVEDGEGAWH